MAREEVIKTELGQRLRDVRRSLGDPKREVLAQDLGFSAKTLANYERGDSQPDAAALAAYRTKLNVDTNWLITGEEPEAKPPVSSSSFAFLPFYEDVEAAAGSGAAVISDAAHSVIGFARDLLRESGASPQTCTVIRAVGDSMMPTIPEGAFLVVDHSQREIVANGSIMVIGVDDDLLVKRIRRRFDGSVELISDNTIYAPETLGPSALQKLRVIGRVVYFCRTP